MDFLEVFFTCMLVLIVVVMGVFVESLALDRSSDFLCLASGYDGGTHLMLFENKTLCYNTISPQIDEVREYFFLEEK